VNRLDSIKSIIPVVEKNRLGQRAESYKSCEPLNVPDWKEFGVEKGGDESCMQTLGKFLDQALVDNPKSLRIFSPDELVSDKLDAVFNHTGRNFQWDEFSNAKEGRVIQILSEHTCQGFMQGIYGKYVVFIDSILTRYRMHTYWTDCHTPKL
jgi:xylulose-5-phosphate/fructose-6-phosphate phosphoketolase